MVTLLCSGCTVWSGQSLLASTFFHRNGHEIIDRGGQAFQIRGVNVSCWLYQENYIYGGAQTAQKVTVSKLKRLLGERGYRHYLRSMMDTFLLPEDIRLMKRMGINCVRLGFDAVLFDDDSTRQWFFHSIDRLLPVFKETNIAILLIMMVPPKAPDKLWCTGYVKGDTLLWDSPAAQQRTIDIWGQIAAHYKDEQMILGYDLLGEPSLPKKREEELIDLYRRISAAIRVQDPHHMLVYEGNNYAIDLSVLSKYDHLLDPNSSYSFHLYTWFGLKMKKRLPEFMKNARLRNRPVFCGEWGINRLTTITEQVQLMNAEKDMDGWIIYVWKALELPVGKEEKKRPPYYGNWFFIPFEKLQMSLLTFKVDDDMRAMMDWMSGVKNATRPDREKARKALQRMVEVSQIKYCTANRQLVEALGLKAVVE